MILRNVAQLARDCYFYWECFISWQFIFMILFLQHETLACITYKECVYNQIVPISDTIIHSGLQAQAI